MVKVEHEGVGAFDQRVRRVLVLLQELELVDDVGLQEFAVFLKIVSDMSFDHLNEQIKTRVHLDYRAMEFSCHSLTV